MGELHSEIKSHRLYNYAVEGEKHNVGRSSLAALLQFGFMNLRSLATLISGLFMNLRFWAVSSRL